MASVGVMEEVSSGEGDNPENNHKRPDGKDPFAHWPVVMGEGGGLADAEDLSAKANGHEDDADSEGEPGQSHGISFTPTSIDAGRGKWERGRGHLLRPKPERRGFAADVRILKGLGRDFGMRQKL